ncbi:MAG: hypothetical protein H0U10_06265 [Chloroflexia bacterium]|nr:hypothetical protein [Chloroflexia bacterium]
MHHHGSDHARELRAREAAIWTAVVDNGFMAAHHLAAAEGRERAVTAAVRDRLLRAEGFGNRDLSAALRRGIGAALVRLGTRLQAPGIDPAPPWNPSPS